MSFVIGTVLAMVFVDTWPLRLLIMVPLALLEVGEVLLWLRWRGVTSITGAEALVGKRGTVTIDCDPEGQVRVNGHLWGAECAAGAKAGDEIVVTKVVGLVLHVERPG